MLLLVSLKKHRVPDICAKFYHSRLLSTCICLMAIQ